MLQKIAAFFNVYRDRKMLIMLALGFASGFPFPLVFNTLSLWLQSDNLALEIIGIFSLSKLPYSFKWLWAPLADKIRLPLLWKLGQRRSWALLSQTLILFGILALACSQPEQHYLLTFALAVFLAFCSATLDIALDAYRVESFTTQEQAAASASFVTGYRFGFLFSGAHFACVVVKRNQSKVVQKIHADGYLLTQLHFMGDYCGNHQFAFELFFRGGEQYSGIVGTVACGILD